MIDYKDFRLTSTFKPVIRRKTNKKPDLIIFTWIRFIFAKTGSSCAVQPNTFRPWPDCAQTLPVQISVRLLEILGLLQIIFAKTVKTYCVCVVGLCCVLCIMCVALFVLWVLLCVLLLCGSNTDFIQFC